MSPGWHCSRRSAGSPRTNAGVTKAGERLETPVSAMCVFTDAGCDGTS